ncbi:hypothetical protein ACFC8N_15905 [Streptomyces sp. NPDC055966]|uniref:hypothetical protein n=1 Tax=unclassified Streptomyces TaxID=2593676 RepID=UPI0035DAA76E
MCGHARTAVGEGGLGVGAPRVRLGVRRLPDVLGGRLFEALAVTSAVPVHERVGIGRLNSPGHRSR